MQISSVKFTNNSYQEKPKVENSKSILESVPARNKNVSPENYKANFMPVFKSLMAFEDDHPEKAIDTAFYRDLYTLIKATAILKNEFPQGAAIMDFACSNGEEAISIYSLIDDKEKAKYKIYCYDTSEKAINMANKGVHSVFNPCTDDFLLKDLQDNELYNEVAECFNEIMEETRRPGYEINYKKYMESIIENPEFDLKYYKLKDIYKDNFQFKKGDIRNINKLGPDKKVGAIYFRNAFYHITDNCSFDIDCDKQMGELSEINRQEIIDEVIDKVYNKLLPGGIFVIGDHEKDHYYLADKHTPENNIFYDKHRNQYLCKKSPVEISLRRDERFKPLVKSKCFCEMGDKMLPTVWQKVKD